MKTFDQTVQVTSGSAAACVRSMPSGTGSSWPAGTATFSRVSAAREQRAHLVADGPAGDTGAELGDPAGALQAGVGGGAGRRVVEALALEEVGAVDRARRHLDEHFALAGHRVGDLVPHQRLGSTGFGNRDRMHEGDATSRPTPRWP